MLDRREATALPVDDCDSVDCVRPILTAVAPRGVPPAGGAKLGVDAAGFRADALGG